MDCLDCSKYLLCRDKNKSNGYKCGKFELRTVRDISDILSMGSHLDAADMEIDMSDVEGEETKRESTFILADEKVNVSNLIENVINSDMLTPVDTKIDDSAVPMAKHFYEFTTGQNFLNVKPYAFQMLYITQLFGEYCPRCSDVRWMREGIKVGDSMALFAEKVQLLENGVCTHCGATRSELILNGELNFYQELAGLAGQRCVTGSTVINTKRGILHVDDFDRGLDLEYTGLSNATILNGDFEVSECQAIYKCQPETAYKMVLENGMSIEGTKEHPMLTANGHIPLAGIEGEYVPVKFGYQCFGTEPLSEGMAQALAIVTAKMTITETELHSLPDLAFVDYQTFMEVLEPTCGFKLDGNTSKYSVPLAVRQSDKLSVLSFLRTYFKNVAHVNSDNKISFTPISHRVTLVVCNYLQMLNIKFSIKGRTVVIDGGSNEIFSTLFHFLPVPNTYSEYTAYERDAEDGNCYWLKVVAVVKTLVKTTYDFVVPNTHEFIANGLISHNSGKSAIVAMCCAYLLHKQLKLQKPNEVYGLLPANVLHGTFVALTYKQAAETLWEPFLAYITDSPWYNLYHDVLDFWGRKYNDEFYKIKDTFLSYKHRRILVYPAGPNKKTLRGRTRFLSCISENELVSTNKGLIPIKDVRVNDRINIGNKFASVTVHAQTGVKEIWKLKLKCGQELNATPQHKICIYEDGKFKKKKLSDLTLNDQVVYTVGGEFPKNLSLEQFIPATKFKDERHRLFQAMQELETFDYTGVYEYSKTTRTRASVGVLISKLVREGYLTKTRKGDYKNGDRFIYSITKNFDISKLVADRNKGCYERRHDICYPKMMTEELAYILGYLVADGCNNGNSLPFKTLIKERRDHYAECVFKVFGLTANIGQYNEMSVAGYKVTNYYANMIYNQWVEYFRSIGLTAAYSADKVVPFTILQSPKKCVIAFLRALFECDALVSTDRGFSYNTTSKKLALQVQQLLFRLGLPNHITKQAQKYKCEDKYGNKKIYHYHVCISLSRNDFAKFHKIFGGKLTLTKFSLQYEKKNWKVRGDSYRANTKRKNCYTTSISQIIKSEKTTPVYDMTVDCVEHAYQASGILVSNSIDEIGWFDNNKDASKVKMDANEVYVALDRSLLTVRSAANRLIRQGFDDIPNGYAFNVSSPSSARDKIMELVHQSKTSKKIFGFKRATWDMNPNITKDDLSEEFVKDPQAAERDYGCNPPLSDNAFFSSFTAIEDCFAGKPNKIKYSFAQRKAKDGSVTRYAKLVEVAKSTKPNVLAIDAGFSNNSYSMVCGHLHEGLPVITCFCEVIPNPGMPVNHSLIFKELMYPVIKERNVKVLISDRWQNIKLMQDAELEFEDLITIAYSLRYDDFWVIKQTMFDGEVLLPKLKRPIEEVLKFDQSKYPHCFTDPVEHLAVQLMTVRDMGNSIDKGDSMTDDTFRAMCLAMHALMDEELFDIFNGDGQEEVNVKGALGYMITKTSGATNKSNEVVNTSSGKPLGVVKSRR